MSLSPVRLDDRSHAELVAEARRRVAVLCPELAVNGGADPTAALIELFTWMTGLAVERLGRWCRTSSTWPCWTCWASSSTVPPPPAPSCACG